MERNLLFIAEIGNNHNGDMDRARRLIVAAKESGCQVAKFQLRNLKSLYRDVPNDVEDLGVEYIKSLLKKYELSVEQHRELSEYCSKVGIEYMCTPWDLKSVGVLEDIGVKRYKISSADYQNVELLDKVIGTGKEIILSTGMALDHEIEELSKYLRENNANFSLLHCNSTYPAPFTDINLNYINKLKTLSDNVGYSGHERGISVSLAAIALGAKIIERHLTEDRELEGPDHQASLLPDEFKLLIDMGKEIVAAMGDENNSKNELSQGAMLNKENLGKSIVAKHFIPKGTVLTKDHFEIMSPGQGLGPSNLPSLVGCRTIYDIERHEFVVKTHVEDNVEEKITYNLNGYLWGVPVRPHDVSAMHQIFDAPVYEFHISYSDLDRKFPDEDWSFLENRRLVVHAPELFNDSCLLDLTDNKQRDVHVGNLNRVCEYSRKLREKANYDGIVPIVANVGGFSTHGFRNENEKLKLYQNFLNNLSLVDEDYCQITIQNMAPFPWHFGGQRYQNIFCDPDEIYNFCIQHGRLITLDTAHLLMYCNWKGLDFLTALSRLMEVTCHLHLSDAKGVNGEGVQMGTGEIDFSQVLRSLGASQSFIVETWQGHKDFGHGFKRDLKFLSAERTKI